LPAWWFFGGFFVLFLNVLSVVLFIDTICGKRQNLPFVSQRAKDKHAAVAHGLFSRQEMGLDILKFIYPIRWAFDPFFSLWSKTFI